MKARKGTVIYFVESLPAGADLVFQRGNQEFVFADPNEAPVAWEGQVRIYPEQGLPVPQSELVDGKSRNLAAGDALFVSDATYSLTLFGAGDGEAVVTAAGIMVAVAGADPCSGHPC